MATRRWGERRRVDMHAAERASQLAPGGDGAAFWIAARKCGGEWQVGRGRQGGGGEARGRGGGQRVQGGKFGGGDAPWTAACAHLPPPFLASNLIWEKRVLFQKLAMRLPHNWFLLVILKHVCSNFLREILVETKSPEYPRLQGASQDLAAILRD